VALGLATSMAACTGTPAPESTETGPVTLSWWDYYPEGSTTEIAVTAQIEAFEAANPNVTIDRRFIAYEDIKKALLQSAGAGDLPDIVIINSPDHQQFAELGVAADLTDKIAEWGEIDQYAEGTIASSTLNDKNYGIPFSANCLALYYNKAMLDEAGVKPPTTWDELSETAAALTTPDRYGFAYAGINNQQATFQFLPTLWQSGGDLTELDSPNSVKALEFWTGLVKDGSVSQEALSWDQSLIEKEFAAGRAAMMINGPWQAPALATDAPDLDYGVALLPEGKEAASVTGGENYMVIAGDKEDAAWNVVKWMQQPEVVSALAAGSGSLPTRADVEPTEDSELYTVFTEQLQVARPRAYGANYAEIANAVVVAIQTVLTGGASAKDALDVAAATVAPLLP